MERAYGPLHSRCRQHEPALLLSAEKISQAGKAAHNLIGHILRQGQKDAASLSQDRLLILSQRQNPFGLKHAPALVFQRRPHAQEWPIWHIATIAYLQLARHSPFGVRTQQRGAPERLVENRRDDSPVKHARKALVLLARLEIRHDRLLLLAKDQVQAIRIALAADKTTLIICGVV